jgi:peptide/nickel transport system substrate-binding protein
VKRRVAAVFLCLVTLAFAACTKQHGPSAQTGTLVVAVQKEPISLNPLLLEGLDAYTYGPILYSYLTNYDASGRVVPDLAAEVPSPANGGVSSGGKTVTYRLRRNVRWQDGAPLTSADVLFTYRAVMNPNNDVPERYGYGKVTSIDAPDRYTVVIHLARAFSPIIGFFFGGDSNYPILPAHLLASLPNVNAVPFNSQPIGSGPYRFARWDRGDRLEFGANPSYYGGKPQIDRLVLPFIAQDATAIDELKTGEVDAATLLDASRIAELREIPNHRVVVTPVPYFYGLAFNLEDPLLADRSIRRAIALAIDRRTLTRKITQGVYDGDTALRGLFTWAYAPHADTIAYDPGLAQTLLSRDGWVLGPDGIRTKDGRRLHFEIALPTGEAITTRFATAIAAAERGVGIDVSLRQYARTQFISEQGPEISGRYQISLYDYQGTVDPDASWLLACDQRSPHGFDVARYCNPAMDALLQRGAASFDRAARAAVYAEVQKLLITDLPYFLICQISEVDVIPTSLQGYRSPLLSPFTSVASWHQ